MDISRHATDLLPDSDLEVEEKRRVRTNFEASVPQTELQR
jgi:hypothetical protein